MTDINKDLLVKEYEKRLNSLRSHNFPISSCVNEIEFVKGLIKAFFVSNQENLSKINQVLNKDYILSNNGKVDSFCFGGIIEKYNSLMQGVHEYLNKVVSIDSTDENLINKDLAMEQLDNMAKKLIEAIDDCFVQGETKPIIGGVFELEHLRKIDDDLSKDIEAIKSIQFDTAELYSNVKTATLKLFVEGILYFNYKIIGMIIDVFDECLVQARIKKASPGSKQETLKIF